MGVPVPWSQMVSAHLQIRYCENGTSRFLMPVFIKNLNISNKSMDKNKLFGEKKFFKGSGMWAPWKKIGRKMKKFKIFFCFLNQCTSDYYHAKCCWNRTISYFLTPKTHIRALEGSKNKNCLISTKFGMVIVRSTLIKKTKKSFEFFHFLAKFLNYLKGPPIKNYYFDDFWLS